MSKLTVSDPELPVDMSVFVYHWYKHNDMNTSATPAVAFTAVLTNPSTTTSYNASFLMNLPLGELMVCILLSGWCDVYIDAYHSNPGSRSWQRCTDTHPGQVLH